MNRLTQINRGNKLKEKIIIYSCLKVLIKTNIDNSVENKILYKYVEEIEVDESTEKKEILNFNYLTA